MTSHPKPHFSETQDQNDSACSACLEKDKRYSLLEEKYQLLQEQYNLAEKKYALLEEQLHGFQRRCENLEYQISQLTRHRFGQKSEKRFTEKKSSSFIPEVINNLNGRKPLPSDLVKETIEYQLPKEELICNICHAGLVKIGEEVSEQLDCIPLQLRGKRHVRWKYGCSHCGGTIRLADKPDQPIAKGLATSNLLAQILVNKYQDHLPLHRQEQIFARHGVDLVRSTLCDWVKECAKLGEVLVNAMKKDLLSCNRVHSDDTPIPVQVSGKKGKTHQGRLWIYIGCESEKSPVVIYDYTQTRSQTGPLEFLKGYEGFLQADAYCGYDKLYEIEKVIEVGCWAHARRKFYEVACATVSERANTAMDFIRQLYEVERQAKLFTVEDRKKLRQSKSVPVLKEFKTWLDHQKEEVLPKSPLGGAIQYTLKLWKALTIYTENGFLEIDNNRAERGMKVVVLGRKNWIFAGSHEGAKNGAIIYSLIETCKQNNINPYEYLADILARLPSHPSNRVHELLPYHWRPQAPPQTVKNPENILEAA